MRLPRAAALTTTLLLTCGLVAGTTEAVRADPHTEPADQTGHGSTESQDGKRAKILRELDTMVERGEPGVAWMATGPGRRSWTATSGVGDLRTRMPMPRDGRFRAASVTKSMVATVVLQLVDEHRLALADTVEAFLPGLIPDGDRITVEQLLTHTSGLADYASTPAFEDPREYAGRTFTPGELVDVAVAADRTGAPGERFAYTNTGYVLLGLIVERRTGRDLADVLRERVFAPAGMTRTFLPITFPFLPGRHASGYFASAGDLVDITTVNPSFAWAAYGVVSTASDLQRFYRALFTGRLLPADLVSRMRTGSVPTGNPIWPDYGYGVEKMATTCGVELWGHTGSIPGYENFTFGTLDGRRQVTVMMNAQVTDPSSAPMKIGAVNAVNLEFCGVPYIPVADAADRSMAMPAADLTLH